MTAASSILDFLGQLVQNNNREWFVAHKEEYVSARQQFEALSDFFITEITAFDESLKSVSSKECLFRIYRDIRFSGDKTPYKNHFGTYMAGQGGRKSPLAGYYLHLQPGESFVSIGVYCPDPIVLKALRWAVYENIDEWNEITKTDSFSKYYDKLYDDGKLKKVPVGFPTDFADAELLKYKHYTYLKYLPDSFFTQEDWQQSVLDMFRAGYHLNRFLNFTITETLNLE